MSETTARMPQAKDIWTPKGRSRGIIVEVIGVDEHVVLFTRSDAGRERQMVRLSTFVDRFEPLVTADEVASIRAADQGDDPS